MPLPQALPLPSATELLQQLADLMRPRIAPATVLVGIHSGGVWVAEALHRSLGLTTPLATLDVSFHRDDHHIGNGLKSGGRASHLPDDVASAPLVLVDDVLYTGRTIRAALNELFDYGRPAQVELAVLVDRCGRELPIAATYCPHVLPLPASQSLDLNRDEEGVLSFKLSDK